MKGMTYEWSTPSGWKINNGGNTKEGLELNSVSITSSVCPTDGIVKVRLKKMVKYLNGIIVLIKEFQIQR